MPRSCRGGGKPHGIEDYEVQLDKHATRWLGVWIDPQRTPRREDEKGPKSYAMHSTSDGAVRDVPGRLQE